MKILQRLTLATLALSLMGSSALLHAQYGPPGDRGGWDAPPAEFQSEAMRRGFHDGIEGARKDFENHREPNVNNRDEYRHPDVPHDQRHDYREGFRRGYDVGVQHMRGDHDHDNH